MWFTNENENNEINQFIDKYKLPFDNLYHINYTFDYDKCKELYTELYIENKFKEKFHE